MPYDFFFSYTRANNDAYLQRFFEDLSTEVRLLRGLPATDAVGFFDQRELELGEDWDGAIVDALSTCKVVLAVASAAYLRNEYCGKELTVPVKDSGIKIPLSITASNRTELIKEKDVRARFGVTVDLDALVGGLFR